MNKKKLSVDFLLNIFASGVMTLTLQLAIYPALARKTTSEFYGVLLAIMGVVNTLVSTFGNSLNNVRLVENDRYELSENGDFNRLLICGSTIGAILIYFLCQFGYKQSYLTSILLVFGTVLGILRTYYMASYRLILDFKKILICNAIIAAGYLVGYAVFLWIEIWPIVFISGELFGLFYLRKTSVLMCNNSVRSSNYNNVKRKYIHYSISSATTSALTYLDRLLILPILGSHYVSIYTVSSLMGKTLGIVMLPIAGVILGYYSQKGFKLSRQLFVKISLLSLLICSTFYLLVITIGKPFVKVLYPQMFDEANNYIILANLAAVISVLGNMIAPTSLRFSKSYWQIVISSSYGVVYCLLGAYLSKEYMLNGFCIAAIIANTVRLMLLYIVAWRSLK